MADWFQGCEHLLEIYVRAISLERLLSQQIKATDPGDDTRLALLMRRQAIKGPSSPALPPR
jgi:hypothetical protein